jgi:hypothetical protein
MARTLVYPIVGRLLSLRNNVLVDLPLDSIAAIRIIAVFVILHHTTSTIVRYNNNNNHGET